MPVNFENGVLGFVAPTDWLDVGQDVTRPNDPIAALFGDERTDNLVARWQSIANEYQVPMMAQFHAFDTESQTTFRAPVDTHNVEKGLIKVKINQSERMRQLTRNGVQGNEQLYDYVLGDGIRLADQVVTRSLVAKNELLATGKVTIKENNLDTTVEYGVSEEQTGFTIDLASTADIPAAIQAVVDAALAKGVILTGVITSNKVMSKIRANEAVQKAINGVQGVGALVRRAALEEYLSSEYGINTVITNDYMYGATASMGKDGRPVVEQKRYYPDNKITFFAANPAGRIGTGLWGDPPAADLPQFDVANGEQQNFVYVDQWKEKDPDVLWTRASALFMPVLHNPGSLWIATAGE